MDLRQKLTVINTLPGGNIDVSFEAYEFGRDTFTASLDVDGYFYLGFNKPINAVYAQLETANTSQTSIVAEYYNGTSWTSLEISDETLSFTRSGFITWNRVNDSEKTTFNSKELHWVRLSTDAATTAMTFQALNLLFSDDNSIKAMIPDLVDSCYYPNGQSSHVLQHVAAKNYIMSSLRNLGYVKTVDSAEENITQWDVLDVYELRDAANYRAISQIYFSLSEGTDDQFWAKYEKYQAMFVESFALGRLRIDQNEDGEVQPTEKQPIKTSRWHR